MKLKAVSNCDPLPRTSVFPRHELKMSLSSVTTVAKSILYLTPQERTTMSQDWSRLRRFLLWFSIQGNSWSCFLYLLILALRLGIGFHTFSHNLRLVFSGFSYLGSRISLTVNEKLPKTLAVKRYWAIIFGNSDMLKLVFKP